MAPRGDKGGFIISMRLGDNQEINALDRHNTLCQRYFVNRGMPFFGETFTSQVPCTNFEHSIFQLHFAFLRCEGIVLCCNLILGGCYILRFAICYLAYLLTNKVII